MAKELKDWCITRNLEWGVRFPGHDDLVVYVWVDAPSATYHSQKMGEQNWWGLGKVLAKRFTHHSLHR